MNEKLKHRSKDNQTLFQLNSRQSRNYLSAKLISLIRANDENGYFSAQELIQIESILRDEFHTNPWILSVCKAITDDSVFVSKQQIEMFEKYKNELQEVSVTQTEVEELHKELDFLKEKLNILGYIFNNLNEINKKSPKLETKGRRGDSVDVCLKMKTKLSESLEIIEKDLNTDFSVDEPKDVTHFIIDKLNDKIGKIDGFQDSNQWLNQLLDELALTEEEDTTQVFNYFNHLFCLKLEDIQKNLINLRKECVRIKEFYDINVIQEISWRTDINALIDRLQSFSNDSKTIELNPLKPETNGLSNKKCLIEKYFQISKTLENQEFDELQALIENMKQRIEKLSDKIK